MSQFRCPGYCSVLYSHSAFLFRVYKWVPEGNCGLELGWTSIPSRGKQSTTMPNDTKTGDKGHSEGLVISITDVRTFARKFSNIDFFSENFTIERWWVSNVGNVKKWGVTGFVLERTCPEKHLNLSQSGFKSKNIAIRALKGNALHQMWRKWIY